MKTKTNTIIIATALIYLTSCKKEEKATITVTATTNTVTITPKELNGLWVPYPAWPTTTNISKNDICEFSGDENSKFIQNAWFTCLKIGTGQQTTLTPAKVSVIFSKADSSFYFPKSNYYTPINNEKSWIYKAKFTTDTLFIEWAYSASLNTGATKYMKTKYVRK